MRQRIVLSADEGKVLTNGETYGTVIFLADTDSPDNYHEITQAEYDEILAEQEQELDAPEA